jgi:hypothetical protein
MKTIPAPIEQWTHVEWDGGDARVLVARGKDGRLAIAAIAVGDPTPEKLRRVPLGRIENALRVLDESVPGGTDLLRFPGTMSIGSRSPGRRYKLKRPAGRRLDDAFYANVARAYREAVGRGLEPRKTIVADTGAADATVARWVGDARKRGYLPPAEPGKVSA